MRIVGRIVVLVSIVVFTPQNGVVFIVFALGERQTCKIAAGRFDCSRKSVHLVESKIFEGLF